MPRLVIGTRVIEFPDSGSSPLWSEAVIDFAQSVESQLALTASAFDVPPRVQILTSDSNSGLNITDCIFPSGSVRSFSVFYAIYRTNGVTSLIQQGEIRGIYDTLEAAWYLNDEFNGDRQADGLPYQSFQMSGDQLQLNTTLLGGAYDTANSRISYSAKTQLKTE